MAESKSAALPLGYAPSGGPEKSQTRLARFRLGAGGLQTAAPHFNRSRGLNFASPLPAAQAPGIADRRDALPLSPTWPAAVEGRLVSWEDGRQIPDTAEEDVMTYRAPINDILLALNHGAGLKAAVEAGHYGDFDADITAAVLEEAGKFASRRAGAAQSRSATSTASSSRTTRSRPRRAGPMPTSAGPRAAGTRCPAPKLSAARACRSPSTPPAPRSGARPTSRSASARC